MNRGKFIVIEGPDGTGKTTLARALAAELHGLYTSEPYNISLDLRGLSHHTKEMMFRADRALHIETTIQPALEAGTTVVCDRYYQSTLVYQRLVPNWHEDVNVNTVHLNTASCAVVESDDILIPDFVFYLRLPARSASLRIDQRGVERSEYEDRNKMTTVKQAYQMLSESPRSQVETTLNAKLSPVFLVNECIRVIDNARFA